MPLFVSTVKKRYPNAKFIYRISDLLALIGGSDELIQYEEMLLNQFDLLVVPNQSMYDLFSKKSPNSLILLQHHGVHKQQYDLSKNAPSPFKPNTLNAVYVGMSAFDLDFIKIASQLFQSSIFILLGHIPKRHIFKCYLPWTT